MRDDHIIDILDGEPIGRIGAAHLARAEAHALDCAACARALDAARVADGLVAARAGATIEPSPFFHTRVMAAVRERREADEPSFARMWRSARALVGAMAAAVALLAGAAVYVAVPASQQPGTPADAVAAGTPYAAEWQAFDASSASESDLSDDQLVAILYESEDAYGQGR
jgi:hypothetical protein